MELVTARRTGPEAGSLPISAYVILGMLNLGARSGYDIKQAVKQSTRYFSTISDAQIYPLLKQLEADGLIEGRAEPRGRRLRRTYELTAAGTDALQKWLREDEPLLLDVWDVGLLKLFFADAIEATDALELVRAIRARSERILEELRRQSAPSAARTEAHGAEFPIRVLPFGAAMHEAWVECCRQLERQLEGNDVSRAKGQPARRSSPRGTAH